ncbi:MAG: hypothetical protein HGA61_03235 [Candidatus Moranbacteria bacterium]|nr:hypothetical protein [Candidatus Moranbacteria bacterium]
MPDLEQQDQQNEQKKKTVRTNYFDSPPPEPVPIDGGLHIGGENKNVSSGAKALWEP